jgi:hypothetical protein
VAGAAERVVRMQDGRLITSSAGAPLVGAPGT